MSACEIAAFSIQANDIDYKRSGLVDTGILSIGKTQQLKVA
jgi:hypothetical protein